MAFAVDLTGTILDRRYRLTGLLGKGGMGHVYDAMHIALEQRVAIKVLHPRYAYEERFRERFLQEARAASKIKHRNVVEIKDFGDTPDGSVYFAMEYLGGHDVGVELAEHGPLSWSRTRNILLQAASALHAAHAKQIIHRDIKPGNCFLIEDPESGLADVVKLLDFGIAKVGSDSHADAQGKGLTGTGEVFGTASYMSPEQARGETLDARSDMYSLGIMAYEMLTGQVPFTGGNAILVITQHLHTKPEPLRRYAPEISEAVEALVMKMIAKAPRDRYASMGEVEQALLVIPEASGEKVRRTKLWSSPGELRALVAHKQAANVGVLPPAAVAGPTPVPVAGGLGVKRTLVNMEPSVEPEARVAAAPAVVEAAPRVGDGTPPSREDPRTLHSTWATSTVSTGPHGSVSDSGTETHPHSLGVVDAPVISGRLVLAVVLLVLLVGGGSALATRMFLANREEPAVEEPAVEEPAVVEPAVEEPAVEEPAVIPVGTDAGSDVASNEAVVPEVVVPEVVVPEAVEETSDDDVVETPTAEDQEVGEAAPRPVKREHSNPAPPKVRPHETDKCAEVRKKANEALDRLGFAEAARLAGQKHCWSPSEQGRRLTIQVSALLEERRFAECVDVGAKARDAGTKKLVETCRKRSMVAP